MLRRTSAIASGLARGGHQRQGVAGVRLGEVRDWSLLQVAGFAEHFGDVELAIALYCGAPAPATVGPVVCSGDLLLMRTGPEQIWIIGPGAALNAEPPLRAAIAPGTGVLTPLSHSRSWLYIEGPRARDVLAKGIAIDLAPDRFGIDHFAMTGLDHTPILLYRSAEDRYEIWAMRTFALTVWDWLADAALEFGYEVDRPGP
jgi:heterotetrameric sarcosine oxidase gamma subunit